MYIIPKLIDFKPHWIAPAYWAAKAPPFYIGVSFLCPHCIHGPCPTCGAQRGKRIALNFWPPIDPEGVLARITEIPHDHFHKRASGDTFETLTILPSVGIEGHWHGNITSGEIT